jgi:hypothetical protein
MSLKESRRLCTSEMPNTTKIWKPSACRDEEVVSLTYESYASMVHQLGHSHPPQEMVQSGLGKIPIVKT